MRRIHYPGALPVALLAACLLAGCDSVEGVLNEDVTFVVESYQEVGEPIRRVRLSRTGEINQLYSANQLAVRGASVRIHLMSESGTVGETFALIESTTEPGVYQTSSNHVVLPLRVYRLEADLPDAAGSLSSETLTPGDFEIVRTGLQEVVYQQEAQFELGLTRSTYLTRQTVFIFSVEGLDAGFGTLTPIYEDIIDPDDGDENELDEYRIVQSPPVNELNYDIEADGTLTVKLPWLAVAFFGQNRVSISAIDDNLYDFLRSYGVQQGGSTLAPGEIPNAIEHVDGGIGLFGSYARVTAETLVLRNE
ncbi:MAG TPA: DUF4249 family protein [Rhodothermales bacterium]|nr:DUF4249 family protein [Rhodothermales bacterium]